MRLKFNGDIEDHNFRIQNIKMTYIQTKYLKHVKSLDGKGLGRFT